MADDAAAKGYAPLLAEHYADYSSLFRWVKLNLNPGMQVADVGAYRTWRLRNYRKGQPDYYLEELYYQFGRYLLNAFAVIK